jgi:hypothetical protein
MLRIARFEQPLGQATEVRAGFLRENIENREEAVRLIEQHMDSFHYHGRNGEKGYWWCRNDADKTNTLLRIEPM